MNDPGSEPQTYRFRVRHPNHESQRVGLTLMARLLLQLSTFRFSDSWARRETCTKQCFSAILESNLLSVMILRGKVRGICCLRALRMHMVGILLLLHFSIRELAFLWWTPDLFMKATVFDLRII
jgi:hypothetical protein